jgi:hypothetical protein
VGQEHRLSNQVNNENRTLFTPAENFPRILRVLVKSTDVRRGDYYQLIVDHTSSCPSPPSRQVCIYILPLPPEGNNTDYRLLYTAIGATAGLDPNIHQS